MFDIKLKYTEEEINDLFKSLIGKFRKNPSKYLEGDNYYYLMNLHEMEGFTETNPFLVREQFLNFVSPTGTFKFENTYSSKYASLEECWEEDDQIMMYKYNQNYLKEVLDVIDSGILNLF